jgi:hypothetical protein
MVDLDMAHEKSVRRTGGHANRSIVSRPVLPAAAEAFPTGREGTGDPSAARAAGRESM